MSLRRWWTYQHERFPVLAHGPLVLAFSFCAVSYSGLLRGDDRWPEWPALVVAFITALLFFLQLRIADEFKDFEDDRRYRPQRPVPRGLVTLRELAIVGVTVGAIQVALALWLKPTLLLWLLIPWLYFALMSKEFFVRSWLVRRPFTYMWTHMLVMPLIDFYATACDWHVQGDASPPRGLWWFLAASYFNGMVIEIGRKIRAPADELPGVSTYSAVWGMRGAIAAWLAVLILTCSCAALAASRIDFLGPMLALLALPLLGAAITARSYLAHPGSKQARMIETMSGLWTLALYLSLGAAPRIFG